MKVGHLAVARRNSDCLTACGIGSCLVITLYDAKHRMGALAHAMLPKRPKTAGEELKSMGEVVEDLKYVDVAVEELVRCLETCGAKRGNLEAKLVGGASMFSSFESDIGRENVLSAKRKLKEEGIRLVGESVGGSTGRSVGFCVSSGVVTVKVKF